MRLPIAALLCVAFSSTLIASQPLETETARLLPAGMFKLEAVFETQTSKEGRERAWPLVVEYGLTDRTEITIEPVFATAIRHRNSPSASGPGDLEVTVTHLFQRESRTTPALAGAGEVKLPTAHNRLIGTGKTDYTLWGIVSKRFSRIDLHGNLGYTVVGRPAGTHLNNIFNYAVAEEFHYSPKFDLVAEFVGNTSATGETSETPVTQPGNLPPEATASERSLLVGMRYYVRPTLFVSVGVSYDNNHTWLLRPGVTYRFRAR
jgi:hypothetical protein